MHDIHQNTVDEFPAIIAAFRAAGATFASLEDALYLPDLNSNMNPPSPPACCNGEIH